MENKTIPGQQHIDRWATVGRNPSVVKRRLIDQTSPTDTCTYTPRVLFGCYKHGSGKAGAGAKQSSTAGSPLHTENQRTDAQDSLLMESREEMSGFTPSQASSETSINEKCQADDNNLTLSANTHTYPDVSRHIHRQTACNSASSLERRGFPSTTHTQPK